MATRIQFRCASCSYLVKVPLAYAGRKGKCPGCKQLLRIPSEAEAARSADAKAKTDTRGVPRPDPKTDTRGAPRPDPKTDSRSVPRPKDVAKAEPKVERKAKPKLAAPLGLPGADVVPPSMPRSEAPTRRMAKLDEPAAASARPPRPARDEADDEVTTPGLGHLFRRVGSEPIRLQVGLPVVIGRSQDCDLTIPSSRVSRRHAQLVWKQGKPYLEDLGSQNGTLVNGAPIQSHRLRDGDEIMVGPFLIGYATAREGEAPDALDFMADSDLKTEFTLVDAMSGRLEEVTLFEVLQTLEFNKKVGTLEVASTSGTARIGVDKGFVVFARLGDVRGAEAVLTAFEWDKGRFRLEPALSHASDLRLPITGLLLEAGRRLDERGG